MQWHTGSLPGSGLSRPLPALCMSSLRRNRLSSVRYIYQGGINCQQLIKLSAIKTKHLYELKSKSNPLARTQNQQRSKRRLPTGLHLKKQEEMTRERLLTATGKRNTGRRKEILKRVFLRVGKVVNLETIDKMTAMAQDRGRWYAIVSALSTRR